MKTRLIPFVLLLTVYLLKPQRASAETPLPPKDMVLIPNGTFIMGSPLDENGRDFWPFVTADETQHEVTISRAFYIAKTEVTKALWDEVYTWALNNGYSDLPAGRNGWRGDAGKTHPVTEVSWYDVLKWCNARSEQNGRSPAYSVGDKVYRTGISENVICKWDANGYRLPTEAEWEYACRAGTVTAFYTGQLTQLFSPPSDPNLNKAGWYYGNSDNTHPVGQKQANAWGLYDTHGNVFEWCWDWYSTSSASPITDPQGPESGFGRVVRGGSWDDGSRVCRSAFREERTPGEKDVRGNSLGFRLSLSTIAEWRRVIEIQPAKPVYGEPPKKEVGKDSLIVVTHGWQPAFLPVDISWVDAMTNAISKYLVNKGLTGWQVHPYRWVEKAQTKNPKNALINGKVEGARLGRHIADWGFGHVHLIAHSAGAGLIQAASEIIKTLRPDTVVHLTFLDAFVGFNYEEKGNYGKGADWSDSYFSRDFGTSGGIYPFTEERLVNSYNIDVTWLDPNKKLADIYRSSETGALEYCYQTTTSHGWPHQFYLSTILGQPSAAEGLGFALSKEGGNWNVATNEYRMRGNTPRPLGIQDALCPSFYATTPATLGPILDFTESSTIKSETGTVIIHGTDFTLKTASPAWLIALLPVTNTVNFVSFEANFLSSGAEGLLSVYWETNVIGSVDERVTSPGIHQYTFPLPETAENGIQVLGFRLDAFSTTQSSMTVTNVALGFVGVREPFSLSFTAASFGGLPVLQLTGPSGFNYRVESSTNLVSWSNMAILVNTNGIVKFVDQTSTNTTARFYRAVVP